MNSLSANSKSDFKALLALIVTAGVFLAPLLWESDNIWGFNSAAYLPAWGKIVFSSALVAAIFFAFYRGSSRTFRAISLTLDRILYGNSRIRNRLILIVSAMSLFYFFRATTHFLGDGYNWIAQYESEFIPYLSAVKWTEFGSSYLVRGIQAALGAYTKETAIQSFQIISIASGGVTVWFLISLAGILFKEPAARILGAIVIVLSPISLLFFGYVEFYPLLWAFLGAFLYFSIRFLNSGGSVAPAIIVFAIGLFVHSSIAAYFPGVLVLALATKWGSRTWRRRKKEITALLVILTAGTIYFATVSIADSAYLQNIFLTPLSGKPHSPGYAIFSLSHIFDIANLMIFIFPLAIVFLLAGFSRPLLTNNVNVFFLATAFGGLVFVGVIDPQLGMARDWDLMSFTMFPLSLLLLSLALRNPQPALARFGLSIAGIALTVTISTLFVNLNQNMSARRFESLLYSDTPKSYAGWFLLGNYYSERGEVSKSKRILARQREYFPEYSMLITAFNYISQGKLKEAYPLVSRVLAKNPYFAEGNLLAGRFNHAAGNIELARKYYDIALELEPRKERAYVYYSHMLFENMSLREAERLAKRGLIFYPQNTSLHELLGELNLSFGEFAEARKSAEKSLEIDSTRALAHLLLTRIALEKPDSALARVHFEEYIKYSREGSRLEENRRRFERLLESNNK